MSAEATADFGLIGLAVMGQNLILNINDHGFKVCAFNRTVSKVDHFLENEAKGTNVIGAHSVEEFVAKLKRPRKIMLLVKAGSAVDKFIETLLPHLEEGDIVIDGGNSHYPDTQRRYEYLTSKNILFVGCGVSGGEEGARHGPSLMPGGNPEAWPHLKPIFQAIAAKAPDGAPCCDWVGEGGAGHFVKMVHNGIEYGDMQLISEVYQIFRDGVGFTDDEQSEIFAQWNKGVLDSFLIEITTDILRFKDEDGQPLLEKIRDAAGQKGTGKWTAIAALDYGMPVTLIGEAVFSRCLSSIKDERVRASKILAGPASSQYTGDKAQLIKDLEQAMYASKIISYAQGFMLMREASQQYKWNLNYGSIALMWRGGCIIRSAFLGDIKNAFDKNKDLENLLFDPFFQEATAKAQSGWRNAICAATTLGIPVPAHSTALSFYDGYRTARLPANMLQAQRDYFGAHTYELEANPGVYIHTNWTGRGGNVHASTYDA
ncbi:phosphogluconate dehydrogenase (decarboxylating) gnd1 [Coemansia sp. RSA 2336]|nr:phosphogluconate dehydrogenase (decarboxylating) gnd1 [Coemansia sp. RSA 2336]